MTTDLARLAAPTALATADMEQAEAALLHYLGTGDLSQLTGDQRKAIYKRTCESLGINALTRPFEWVEFYDPETRGKKLVLYPRAACADQLAYQHRIRIEVVEEKIVGTLFKVEMRGTLPQGRTETNVAYLDLTDRDGNALRGQRLGNAYMKARTKCKRRLVFGMVGMMAPPDVEDLQQARVVTVDGSGNVIDHPTPEQKALAADPRMARTIGEPTFEDVDADAVLGPSTGAHQRPRQEDLAPPQRADSTRPNFRCDKARWSRVWATLPNNVLLDDEPARRRYIANYTSTWPEAARTDSLSRLLDVVTDAQAQRFMDDAREWLADRAAAEARDPDGELEGSDGLTNDQADDEAARQMGDRARSYEQLFGDDEVPAGPPKMTPEGHAAAVLTGAPITSKAEEVSTGPERLDPDREYGRAELFELYDGWAGRMKALDRLWKPDNVRRLADQALRRAVEDLSSQVTEDHLSRFGSDETDDGQAD